jgi:hypothetical protein
MFMQFSNFSNQIQNRPVKEDFQTSTENQVGLKEGGVASLQRPSHNANYGTVATTVLPHGSI